MLKFARFLKQFKREVLIGPVFKLTEAVFELIVPLVMAQIIDVGIANGDRGYVLRMGGVMVLLGLVGLGCALICQYCAARASQGFGTVLRSEMFRHINTLSHGEIDQIGTPSLITRITNDVNQLQLAVAMLIRLVVRAPFLVIGATVMALLLDWKLACIFFVAAPLMALVLYLVMSRSIPFYRIIQKKLDRISLITRENLSGVRVIRAFSRQEKEKERFAQASEDQMSTSIAVGRISALLNPLTSAIINLAIAAVIWFGGFRVDAGGMTQGEVIAFVNYLNQILLAMIVVANLVVIFTKAAASATRVDEVLQLHPSIVNRVSRPAQEVEGSPEIAFDAVSFAYPDAGAYSLSDISFTVARGQTLGIIGGTGCGKSTLVNLIPRFYEVSQGSLKVDGVDVRDYPMEQLRGKVGIVPQRAVLFSGTLRQNMQWRKQDATDEEIWQALETAQAASFVRKMPDGLDSVILQGGKNLSGGQKQRLTIARALVGEPEILILDDSASALDFATDAALRQAIAKFSAERGNRMTTIIVSQRANTVRYADQIVVLDDGKAAGIGTHEQLLENCQTYQEIYWSQNERQEAVAQKGGER
ncbi:MAG TPA: ABC transporter ATP-binding protein/permease [Candidatus Negativibacillus faecipullorum]|nr:ABC transporter ATP-binding protein/permease [Candidatus Negativibacillus faecipullorum]